MMGVHEEVQREAEQQAKGSSAAEVACSGPCKAEEMDVDHGACSDTCQPGTSTKPPEGQPFVLPLGVMARNEVYPRTCRKW